MSKNLAAAAFALTILLSGSLAMAQDRIPHPEPLLPAPDNLQQGDLDFNDPNAPGNQERAVDDEEVPPMPMYGEEKEKADEEGAGEGGQPDGSNPAASGQAAASGGYSSLFWAMILTGAVGFLGGLGWLVYRYRQNSKNLKIK